MRIRTPSPASRLVRRAGLQPVSSRRSSPSPEDEVNRRSTELMARYRDTRDAAHFEQLYGLTRDSVLSWIKSLLGREHAALDPAELLQDTFINVYRYPTAFREEHAGSFRVWVRTIAGNVLRRATARRGRALPIEVEPSLELADRGQGPVQAIDEGEDSDRLRRAWMLFLYLYAQAWQELSQRDRRTLHLVEVEGLSYQQAGEVLAVGRSNMKMIVFRSRRRIARRMREAFGRVSQRTRPGPVLVA